jgi:hypothetical protein
MGRRKDSTTIYLESGTLARLKRITERTGVPMSVNIRAAVDEWLARNDALGGAHDGPEPIASPS